jgi:arylsulfatase A-like enzyme
VGARARQVDVLPTVLEYLGLPLPGGLDGRALLAAIGSSDPGAPVESYAQTNLARRKLEALTSDGWKLIRSEANGRERFEAFDLRRDPHELAGRAPEPSIRSAYGRQALAVWAMGDTLPEAPVATREVLDRLRALGYSE